MTRVLGLLAVFVAFAVHAQPRIPDASRTHKRSYLSAVQSVWGLNSPAWLAAQVEAESGWRDGLVSSANARGLCQFIPSTAAGMERLYPGLANQTRYSPYWCYYAQSLLMRDLYKQFKPGRDECNGIKFASAGYNGAPSTLQREIAVCLTDKLCDPTRWDANVAIKTSRKPEHWKENRNYVARIARREPTYVQDGWGIGYCTK